MSEIIFTQKFYSDVKERKLYPTLQSALQADDNQKKEELSALCMGEFQYFDDGAKDVLEYAVPQRTSVIAQEFRNAVKMQNLQGKGKAVFADNMMFVGENEECVVVDTPTLPAACKVLLNNLGKVNRISIHKMVFGTKGFATEIDKGIQLFIEPYHFWSFEEIQQNCEPEMVEQVRPLHEQGYNLFGGSTTEEVVCLLGDCYIIPQEIFESWADYKAPKRPKPQPKPADEPYMYLDLSQLGGLPN